MIRGKDLNPGQESHELLRHGKDYCVYEYKHLDGEIYHCVGRSLSACRGNRDVWLIHRMQRDKEQLKMQRNA